MGLGDPRLAPARAIMTELQWSASAALIVRLANLEAVGTEL